MSLRALIVLLFALTGSFASAEMYSWRDESGRMHYSDQPPPDIKTQVTKKGTSSGPRYGEAPAKPDQSAPAAQSGAKAEPAKPKTLAEKELELKQRKAAEEAAEKKQKETDAQKETMKNYCDSLRKNLEALQSGSQVTKQGPNGEGSYLDNSQIQKEIDDTKAKLAKDCK